VTAAFGGTVQNAILLSSDLDFRPAVQAAVERGMRVTVAGFRHQATEELAEAGDRWLPLSVPWCVSVCPPETLAEKFWFHHISMPRDDIEIAWGPYRTIRLTRNEQGDVCVWGDDNSRPWVAHRDIVEKVFARDYGDSVKLPPGW